MHILIIDDEQPTLRMFGMLLQGLGHEVLTAESGEEGLLLFHEHTPPLVLTDIKMPGIDGIEVLTRIKETKPSTEVVVITGHGDMDLAIQALHLDATDFINKPLTRDALTHALARVEERIRFACSNSPSLVISLHDTHAALTVRGVLSSTAEAQVKEAFGHIESRREIVILDFEENTSVNGAALDVLAECIRKACQGGKKVGIAGVSENFSGVFRVMGISRLVVMGRSVEQVLSELSTPQ